MTEAKLYPVSATGLTAYCSDLIVDPEDVEATAYFISLAGYQGTVKGIVANLLEYYSISIGINGTDHYYGRADVSYRILKKKLSSGFLHSIVLPQLAFPKSEDERQNRFFIITKKKNEVLSLFFRHLDERTELPLHPSWSEWLWNKLNEEECIITLNTLVPRLENSFHKYGNSR